MINNKAVAMSYHFEQIKHAYQVQDPTLIDMLLAVCQQPDPIVTTPIPDNELTFEKFLEKIFSAEFRAKHPDVQFAERLAMITQLETQMGVYPLPDRFKIYIILQSLWQDNNEYARALLLSAIDKLPLSYGVWKGFKSIFKDAEAKHDYEMFSRIAVRIDCERFDQSARTPVIRATKVYMSLRAWRFLRNIGEQSAFLYPTVATQVLACYPADFDLNSEQRQNSWLFNHIFFHNDNAYGAKVFSSNRKRKLFDDKARAFAETWQRNVEPLFYLLMLAKNEAVRQFATDSLKHDFKHELRDVTADIIQQLSAISPSSSARDEIIIWLIGQSPNFEQSQFKALGLHDVVLKLLFSDYSQASSYAFDYAKSYANDLPISTLLLLANSNWENTRKFAIGQLLARDARKDVGGLAWGQLLSSSYHHSVASEQLLTHFDRKDLSKEWFLQLLLSKNQLSIDFAIKNLLKLHHVQTVGLDYFLDLIAQINDLYAERPIMDFALNALKQLGLKQVPSEVWQMLLLHPLASEQVDDWFDSDEIPANSLPIDYWQALASEKDWQKNAWIKAFTTPNDKHSTTWQYHVKFDEERAKRVVAWLADVRQFVPVNLGFEWLLGLAKSGEIYLRSFAISTINKGFLPADFAPSQASTPATTPQDEKIDVDLQGQSFLFTGKMQSMTRDNAENLVKNANGKISGAVNNKLDYLVIGDDGSPLYGNGRKGSKQLKAEELIGKGATLKIISETAFLQMLSGQTRQVDDNQTLLGAEYLWQMATDDPTSPMSELAVSYITHHHAELCLALTDRPVDPDAVIPKEFFSSERFIPLLNSGHSRLRQFALQVIQCELANWRLTADEWRQIAEVSHQDVKDFVKQALLDKQTQENRRYHIGVEKLSAEILYHLIDSQKYFTRKIGLTLLLRYPQFHDVKTLYRLTESTDREVRYESVKMLWQSYKTRTVPSNWQPKNSQNVVVTSPDELPATLEQLLDLLKRGLFELPPARLVEKTETKSQTVKYYHGRAVVVEEKTAEQKPISASKAKLALIETYRDVALEDREFARLILPLLQQFTLSAGKMERHACLVAVTRILTKYPEMNAIHCA